MDNTNQRPIVEYFKEEAITQEQVNMHGHYDEDGIMKTLVGVDCRLVETKDCTGG